MIVPDSWIIIKINIQGTITYRLYSCWIGGYWDSDYWRLNSGITSITAEEGGSYIVKGNSTTEYRIHPQGFKRLSSYCLSILDKMVEGAKDGMSYEIIDIEQYLKENNE